jgi:hypothetical protein
VVARLHLESHSYSSASLGVGLMMEVGGDLHACKAAAHGIEQEEQEESRELPAEPASDEYRR